MRRLRFARRDFLPMPLTFLQYITPSRLAGAEYFFLRVISHLAEMGHRVIVVTKRDTPLRAEIEKLENPNIVLHAWHTHGKIDPQTLMKLCQLIRDERIDIINTHLTTASWQGALAGKICGVPSVAVVHATDRKTWFQHADYLIAVSGGVKDALIEQGIAPEKIEVLYHGIDLEQYVAPLETAAAKARLNLPADAQTVGVVASLIPRKGHRFLLEALKNMEAPVHALFAGEGELDEELRGQVREMGLEKRVHFLGFRRDVPEIVCAMDAFVLPSLKEGLSIAVMEAMALEKPVICSAIAGLPEVVRDGQTGFLVPPGDSLALQNALEKLFADENLRQQLGHNARRFLEEHFEQNACLDAMESYFRRIVSQHNQSVGVSRAFGAATPATADVAASLELSDEPLRIVQLIAPSKIAGAERSTISLCRGLSARGHKVSLLVKYSHELLETARDEGVDALSMRFAGKLNLMAVGRLARWFRRNRVDLVATQLSTASLWGTLAARYIGVPSVATVRALNSKTCYIYADRIITVSHAVKDHLIEQGVEASKIRVVYNGVDLSKFAPPANRERAKSAVDLPRDALIVGVVAHLTAKKGHKWFLDAVAPLFQTFPDLKILFVGEGEERANLRQQVIELKLENRVIFAGFHPDVVPWMSALDVLVLPPIAKEGFGRVLVEAGAMSIPVIGTDVGGIGEVIVPGETGFVVAPGDADALQTALSALLDDAELREKMGAAGRKRALSEYSQERMVEQTESVYRELLAERATIRGE